MSDAPNATRGPKVHDLACTHNAACQKWTHNKFTSNGRLRVNALAAEASQKS